LYLQRHYHAYVSPTTILKLFHRHRVGPVSKKKYRPGPKPADAPLQVPGSVQLDVKFVPRIEKRFHNKKDLTRKLKRWEKEYNEDRPHLALKGKTPAERVCELAQPSEPVRDLC